MYTKKDRIKLRKSLLDFGRAEHLYALPENTGHCSDGVKFLVDRTGCDWLLELIVSELKHPLMTQGFLSIEYRKIPVPTKTAKKYDACLFFLNEYGTPLRTVWIKEAPFPFEDFTVYYANRVLLLPNEY